VLHDHRIRQQCARLPVDSGGMDTGLVFTAPDGNRLHPASVTDHFHEFTTQAG
jgi:hypothetical protein